MISFRGGIKITTFQPTPGNGLRHAVGRNTEPISNLLIKSFVRLLCWRKFEIGLFSVWGHVITQSIFGPIAQLVHPTVRNARGRGFKSVIGLFWRSTASSTIKIIICDHCQSFNARSALNFSSNSRINQFCSILYLVLSSEQKILCSESFKTFSVSTLLCWLLNNDFRIPVGKFTVQSRS